MSWILLTLLNVFGNGSVIFFTKSAIRDTKLGYAGVMFITLLFAIIIYLPIFAFSYVTHPVISSSIEGYYFLSASIILSVITFYIYFHAIAINDLSVFGPLDSTRPFFVILFSLFLLGQSPTLFILFGAVLIFLGVIVLTISRKFFTQAGNFRKTFFVILSTGMFGFISIIDKKALFYIDPIKYVFFILLSVCVASGVIYFSKTRKVFLKQFLSLKLVAMGAMWVIGYVGIMSAVKISTPNQVIPLQMTRSLYLSFLGFVLLREKGYIRKIVAAIIMLLGVFILVQ
jgi:drug/metabolite transporter (DMT)-like permease